MFAGDDTDRLGESEFGDGVVGGEAGGSEEVGGAGGVVVAADVSELKEIAEGGLARRDVEIGGGDKVDEAARQEGGEFGEIGEASGGAAGDGGEEDEFGVNEVGVASSKSGGNN